MDRYGRGYFHWLSGRENIDEVITIHKRIRRLAREEDVDFFVLMKATTDLSCASFKGLVSAASARPLPSGSSFVGSDRHSRQKWIPVPLLVAGVVVQVWPPSKDLRM